MFSKASSPVYPFAHSYIHPKENSISHEEFQLIVVPNQLGTIKSSFDQELIQRDLLGGPLP